MGTLFRKGLFKNEPEDCFLCGEKIVKKKGYVYWQGMTGIILLHIECSVRLSIHLASDSLKLEKEQKEYIDIF